MYQSSPLQKHTVQCVCLTSYSLMSIREFVRFRLSTLDLVPGTCNPASTAVDNNRPTFYYKLGPILIFDLGSASILPPFSVSRNCVGPVYLGNQHLM